MALTYTALASVTVGSGGAANIEFTSIPGTYTDLMLKLSLRTDRSSDSDYLKVTVNNNTSSYSDLYLRGNGSAVASGTNSTTFWEVHRTNASTSTASTFGNIDLYIPNYGGSNNKSGYYDGVNENNATLAYAYLGALLWSNSAAITSIKMTPGAGTNFVQYSTATLYGIKNS